MKGRTCDSSRFSAEGTLTSASKVPHCGEEREEEETEEEIAEEQTDEGEEIGEEDCTTLKAL